MSPALGRTAAGPPQQPIQAGGRCSRAISWLRLGDLRARRRRRAAGGARGGAEPSAAQPASQARQIPRLALLSAPHVGQRTNTLLPSPFLIGNRFGSPPSHSAARTRGARTSSATLFSPANVPHRGNPSRQPVAPPPLPLTPPVRIRYSAPRLSNGRTIAIITRLRRRQRDLSAPSAPRRDFAAV